MPDFCPRCDGAWDKETHPAPVEGGWKGLREVLNSSLDLLKQFARSGQACEANVWGHTEWRLLFSSKWVGERPGRGLRPAPTQSPPRLAAPAHSLTAVAISAMSILYQQWDGDAREFRLRCRSPGQKRCAPPNPLLSSTSPFDFKWVRGNCHSCALARRE